MSSESATNEPTVQRAFHLVYMHFHTTGEWPHIVTLQRQLASDGEDIDLRTIVMQAADHAFISGPEQQLHLTLRGLAAVPAARPLLEAYLVAVRFIIDRYSDPTVEARITSADIAALSLDPVIERELSSLLPDDGWPLGSGSRSDDGTWTYDIPDHVLAARDADTVEALLAVRHGERQNKTAQPIREEPQPLTTEKDAAPSVNPDEPITTPDDDLLDRARLADVLAAAATAGMGGHGVVMGMSGPWGSGKTSLLNLVEAAIRRDEAGYIVRFDPWLFSSSDELVLRFLREVAAQFRQKRQLRRLAATLGEYAQILAPVGALMTGPWAIPAATSFAGIARLWRKKHGPLSAEAQRENVRLALKELDRRVVVLIDDLDRLQEHEVRDVVRLVKLVGDFPNTTYVLAYDQARVARALGTGDEQEGQQFLEKIVQVSHDVPETTPEALGRILTGALSSAIGDLSQYHFDRNVYTNLFGDGLGRLFTTIREVRRYANALPEILTLVGDEIELADVLALEAIRSRAPASFSLIRAYKHSLTQTRDGGLASAPEGVLAAQVNQIVEAAGSYQDEIAAIVKRLFPAAARHLGGTNYGSEWRADWRRNRRVAHPEVLDIYLGKALPPGVLAAAVVEAAFASLEDRDTFSTLLQGLDSEQLEVLLDRLEHYEAEFPTGRSEAPVALLYNHRARLRDRKYHVLDVGADHKVGRIVLRLLRKQEQAAVARATRAALAEISTLSDRGDLVRLVGYREDSGHQLVSENDASDLESALFDEILTSDGATLGAERELSPLLWWVYATRPQETCAHVQQLIADDLFLLRLLRAALRETLGQPIGDAAVQRSHQLNWKGLTQLVPHEQLAQRVRTLDPARHGTLDDLTVKALEQAQHYADHPDAVETDSED